MLRLLYVLGSVVSMVTGVWMLIDPASWYAAFPGGIPDTGPFNAHFIKDIGVMYAVFGLAFGWCAFRVARARPIHLVLTAYVVGHALLHVTDLTAGRLPQSHWRTDATLVFLPAIAMALLALPPVWRVANPRALALDRAYPAGPDR